MVIRSISLLVCIFLLASFSFTRPYIEQVWLFTKTVYAGNIPKLAGKPSNGANKELSCYIEVKASKPQPEWQIAHYNGSIYTIVQYKLNQDSVILQKAVSKKVPLVIKHSLGNYFIMLAFTLKGEDATYITNQLVLEGTLNNKKTMYKATVSPVALAPVFMP